MLLQKSELTLVDFRVYVNFKCNDLYNSADSEKSLVANESSAFVAATKICLKWKALTDIIDFDNSVDVSVTVSLHY